MASDKDLRDLLRDWLQAVDQEFSDEPRLTYLAGRTRVLLTRVPWSVTASAAPPGAD